MGSEMLHMSPLVSWHVMQLSEANADEVISPWTDIQKHTHTALW